MSRFDEKSVQYLRPDLEFNQLNKFNVEALTMESGFDTAITVLTGHPLPRARTTGNGIVFLEGGVNASPFVIDDLLGTLPEIAAIAEGKTIVVSGFLGYAQPDWRPYNFIITNRVEVRAGGTLPAIGPDFLLFDNAVYFRG